MQAQPQLIAIPARPELIAFRDVEKTYKTPAGDFVALKDITLHIRSGEFLAVVGKSGSGKTTLANLMTGIDSASAGHVVASGTALTGMSEDDLTRWRGKNVGVVFQFFQLLPTLSVIDNIMLAMDFVGIIPNGERQPRALSLLQRLGIETQANKLPIDLSGGQQQRAAIARALANDPPILVADEPTGNLDSATTGEVMKLFESLTKNGKTVVMVTHERDLTQYFTRIVELADGRVVADTMTGGSL